MGTHPTTRLALAGLLVLNAGTTGCNPSTAKDDKPASREKQAALFLSTKQVVNDNTAFAVDLYHQLRAQQGNLFLSPYSISTALAMTYAGARGHTQREMAAALHFTQPHEQLHPIMAAIQARLAKAWREDEVELVVANTLWPRQGLTLQPDFLRIMEQHYHSHLTPLDFSNPEPARQIINEWVLNQTQKRIQDLIQPGMITAETVLVLVNAIYFNGRWLHPFDPKNTRPLRFHVTPTRTVNAPTMHRTGEFGYGSDEDVQLLELKYRGGQLSMVVVLPKAELSLAALEKGLTAPKLIQWLNKLHQADNVIVAFPKFTTTTALTLNEPLKALGMKSAFANADFSGIFGQPGPHISAVVHQAFVSVDEAGTEAAAATGVMMKASLPPSVQVDRPFLFLIRDRSTGSILFLGRITDPTAG